MKHCYMADSMRIESHFRKHQLIKISNELIRRLERPKYEVEIIKRASAVIIVSLFLAGLFLVPGIGISPVAHLQESSSSASQCESNNIPASLSFDRVPRVAIYNETNSTNPVYVSGVFFNNNHTFVVNILEAAGYQVSYITAAEILQHQLTTANFDVFVLDSNFPRENIIDYVKDFWLSGGGVLSLSDGNMYLAYSGILPRETEGISNGRGVYWKNAPYDDSNLTIRNPITQSYPSGGQITDQYPGGFGITSESYSWINMTTTSIAGDLTKLAVSSSNGDLVRAISLDPSTEGGKVVQIGLPTWYTFYVSYLSNWGPLLVDSVAWLAPKPKARIAFDMSHNPYFGIDAWDSLAYVKPQYTKWRDLMVSQGYTVDKFYPTAQGNLTSNRLANYDILVEVLPRINFTSLEVEAVQTWNANGHGLLVMGDNKQNLDEYNGNVNHLLNSLPLNISRSADGQTGTSVFGNPNHPTTEGVLKVYFGTSGLINYSGSVAPILGFAADKITAASYRYVNGRIILVSDINWMEDTYFLTNNNKQFSSNIIDWLSVKNGDILIYVDEAYYGSVFRSPLALALDELGLHFYLTSDGIYTNISLLYQDWSLVIIAEINYDISSIYNDLKGYIDQGGRVLMETRNLQAHPNSPLWAIMGIEFVQNWQDEDPAYIWQTGHPIFNTPIHYSASTLNLTGPLITDEGDRVRVFDNATALAGNSTTPSESGSAITVRNDGQTLLNTFLIDSLRGDADDSAYVDRFEIWINEVAFMMRPETNSPPDITYEAGSTGHAITWNPASRMPATFELDVDGTTKQSGTWNGSSVTYNVDGLDPGTYSVRLTIADTLGEETQDTVIVTVQDTTSPTLVGPADFSTSGTVNIRWNASDLYPASWTLYVNGTEVNSGTWTGDHIDVSVVPLDTGVYNYTLLVTDESGNMAADMVMVTVVAPGLFGFDTTTLILVCLGVLLLAIIVAAAIKRHGSSNKHSKKPAPKPKKK